MPLPGAGILPYVRLGLAGPTLAPACPNLPALKLPGDPAAGEQTRRLADRRRDAGRALARQNRVFGLHRKNHTCRFLTCLSLLPPCVQSAASRLCSPMSPLSNKSQDPRDRKSV